MNVSRLRCLYVCIAACSISWLSNLAFAADVEVPPSNAADEEKVRFALAALKAERMKLVSGFCRFDGTYSVAFRDTSENTFDGPLHGLVAIDHGKMRYEMSRPDWVVDPESITTSTDPAKPQATARMIKGILGKQFANDGTRSAIWVTGEPLIVISQSTDMPSSLLRDYADVRCPTLFDRLTLNKRLTLEQVFDNMSLHLGKFPQKVTHPDPSTWVIDWTITTEEAQPDIITFSLTLNAAEGFTPTLFKCSTLRPRFAKEGPITEWENSTKWKSENGVWVPVSHVFHQKKGPFSGVEEQQTLNYVWEKVNQEIDSNVFTYKDFTVPESTAVQDISSGTAVWIKPLPVVPTTALNIPSLPAVKSTTTGWIVAINIVFILVVAVMIWRFRRPKSGETGVGKI